MYIEVIKILSMKIKIFAKWLIYLIIIQQILNLNQQA